MIPIYHGDNGSHEFYESADHSLLILRNHGETNWTAHRNHMYVGSAATVQGAASLIGGTIAHDHRWEKKGAVFSLKPNDETILVTLESIPNLPKFSYQDDWRVVLTIHPSGRRYLYGGETGKPTEIHGGFQLTDDPLLYITAVQEDVNHNLGDWLTDIARYNDIFPYIGKA